MWSNIVKKDPPPSHSDGAPAAIPGMVGNCKSKKGISTVVFDANAVIQGGQSLTNLADKLVTVREVISEIRDPDSLRRLEFITYTIEEPSRESLRKVDKFARATGDFPSLSDVDRKLIALTYTLEALVHGTKNLRDVPPPIKTVRVKILPEKESPEKELPGWGSNVANLDEWEALEKETEEISNSDSRILALKDLNMNIIPEQGEGPKKTEDGKMVVDGLDASQGQCDDDDDDHSGGWTRVVSRSTHRKNLGRKARRDAWAEQDQQADKAGDMIVDTPPQSNDIDALSSESSVACITGDYAMQNVIIQMGLRLLAPGGMQIRQLKRWIWLCHCCGKAPPDILAGFCDSCGNGGTVHKVAAIIDANGTIIAASKPHISLRGTKFPIPMPKGGRDGITKNMVLRADQLPLKFLHPKTKKKASKPGDDCFVSEDVFLNHQNAKKAPFQPPLFNHRRNRNDNHYSRFMH